MATTSAVQSALDGALKKPARTPESGWYGTGGTGVPSPTPQWEPISPGMQTNAAKPTSPPVLPSQWEPTLNPGMRTNEETSPVQSALENSLRSARERGWKFRRGDDFSAPPAAPPAAPPGGQPSNWDSAFQRLYDQSRNLWNSETFAPIRQATGQGPLTETSWANVEAGLPQWGKDWYNYWRQQPYPQGVF